ncbi:uncharacterized protein [Mytilus edulis]
MSAFSIKRQITYRPHEALERMLNKTTLSTQRVQHNNVIDLGNRMLLVKDDDSKERQEKLLSHVLDEAEARHTRELRAALKRLRDQKDEEKKRAVERERNYYEKKAERIETQRNELEAERFRELTKKLEKEKQAALAEQWEYCERLKEEAIVEAKIELTKQLRKEFTVEKEQAIAEALKKQKEKLLTKEKENIEKTIKECEEKARKEAERVAKLHQKEIDRLNDRYNALERKYQIEYSHRHRVEEDFRCLQDDYKRFLDHTDGKFHSDYLMRLRYTGLRLANKRISDVTYEDVYQLK